MPVFLLAGPLGLGRWWSGLAADGSVADTCDGWTAVTGDGTVGDASAVTDVAIHHRSRSCRDRAFLVCVQQ